MPSSIEMLKIDLVDQLEYMVRAQLEPDQAESASVFVRSLFANVPPSDLVPQRPESLLDAALSLLEFVRERQPNVAKVRVYEPRARTHGTEIEHTLIDIVNDDMPFLVDSVRGALERAGCEVRLL